MWWWRSGSRWEWRMQNYHRFPLWREVPLSLNVLLGWSRRQTGTHSTAAMMTSLWVKLNWLTYFNSLTPSPTPPLLLLSSHTLPSSYTLSSLLAYTPFFLPHTQSSTDVDEDIDYVLSVMDELTQELVKEGEVATPSQNSMISVLIPSPPLPSPPLSSPFLSASFPLPQSKQSWHSMNKASSLTKTPCVLPSSASQLLMLSAQFVRSEHFSQ